MGGKLSARAGAVANVVLNMQEHMFIDAIFEDGHMPYDIRVLRHQRFEATEVVKDMVGYVKKGHKLKEISINFSMSHDANEPIEYTAVRHNDDYRKHLFDYFDKNPLNLNGAAVSFKLRFNVNATAENELNEFMRSLASLCVKINCNATFTLTGADPALENTARFTGIMNGYTNLVKEAIQKKSVK